MTPELILTHLSGPQDGRVERLIAPGSPPEVTFGRLATCTISLPDDPELSRSHARLYWRDGEWWLEDLGSANGTFIGEFEQTQKISSVVRLSPGQIFRVGLARFRIEAVDEQSAVGVRQVQAVRG